MLLLFLFLQIGVMNLFFEFLLLFVIMNNSFLANCFALNIFYNSSWVEVSLGTMSVILMILIVLGEPNHNLVVLARVVTFFSILFFGAQTVMFLYFVYELLMFFILLIIFTYGSQPEKMSSIFFMITYTGGVSLPFLYVIFNSDSWPMTGFCSPFFNSLVVLIFLVKTPIYLFHVWLPKAHVEAPTVGSMLLAGILLKVGVYGSMKVWVMTVSENWVVFLTILGFSLAGIFSLVSSDSKSLSAYSSVVHMNLILYALSLMSLCSGTGGTILSVSHGYVSTLIFYFVGTTYSVNGTRIIYITSGLNSFSSFILFFIFLTLCGNVGFPPLLSFWGEILVLIMVFSSMNMMILVSLVYFIYAMVYSIYLMMHIGKTNFFVNLNPSVKVVMIWVLLLFTTIPL